jgi:glycosyltransferase involved in cell wall biosynthesis
MMRVALFSGNYNYLREGANQALNRLVRYLEEVAGHEVRVYSPVTDTPAFKPAGTLVPVPSIPLPVRSEFRLALGLPRSIRQDIERFAPNVIHLSTPDILNTRAQTFAKRLDIPIVASMHTRFETYLDYYWLGWTRPLAEAHLDRFYRRSDHVLVPTPALASDMRRTRGDDQVTIWSRGVDRALFDPARRDPAWRRMAGFADTDTVVLFFGRLVAEKGIETFVSVVDRLQRRGEAVRALVIGHGPARDKFCTLPGVVLTGHLEGEELARAVASADILLHPSTTETFGNVVLEAMACGLAVVAADAPSARSILEDGQSGAICPPSNLARFEAQILTLVGSPKRRAELGAAARERSFAYSWDEASASVEQAYQSLQVKPGQRDVPLG